MTIIKITGDQAYRPFDQVLKNGDVLDLTGATFHTLQSPTAKNLYPLNLGEAKNVRITGGVLAGDTAPDVLWGTRYSGGNSAAILLGHWRDANDSMAGAIVERVRFRNIWDGVRTPTAPDFALRDVWVEDGADDFIENDRHQPGTLENSLLDGVFVAVSCQNAPSALDGSKHVMNVRDNLIRMRPMPGWPIEDKASGPAFGRVFKWESQAPRLRLVGNTFLLPDSPRTQYGAPLNPFDDLGYGALWRDVCIESLDNLLIWTGQGDYPWPVPDGFTLSRDLSLWERKRLAWIAEHRDMRLPGDPDPAPLDPSKPSVEDVRMAEIREQVLPELQALTERLNTLTTIRTT